MKEITNEILEKLNTLVVVINNEGLVEYVSPAVKTILGYDPEQLLGDKWWDLTRRDAKEISEIKSHVRGLIRQEQITEYSTSERQLITANGFRKWIMWSSSKGPNNSIINIGHDITENKRIQETLEIKNRELINKNAEILESIEYAKRIQESILRQPSELNSLVNDSFIYYKPKDLVSGDLYFFYSKNNKLYLAAIDCTGHGVPGAMMSMLANSLLREIIVKKAILDPVNILKALDEELMHALNNCTRPTDIARDGMDIALVEVDLETNLLTFAGAFRPLLLIRNGEVKEFAGCRFPIGFFPDVTKNFEQLQIQLEANDVFYLFSDGYADQFGGEKGKKFNKKRFKELLLSIQDMSMEEQEAFLDYALKNWKQEEEQVDDILVIGVKI